MPISTGMLLGMIKQLDKSLNSALSDVDKRIKLIEQRLPPPTEVRDNGATV